MKKRLIIFLFLIPFLLGSCNQSASVGQPFSKEDSAPRSEEEQSFSELDRMEKRLTELEANEHYRRLEQSEVDEMERLSKAFVEEARRYFQMTDPSWVENGSAMTPRYLRQFVCAKRLCTEIDALLKDFHRLKNLYLLASGNTERQRVVEEMTPVLAQLDQYGVSAEEEKTIGKRPLPNNMSVMALDKQFLAAMEDAGFSISKTGSNVLFEGLDGAGREWRVVGDEPGGAFSKLGYAVHTAEEKWNVVKIVSDREKTSQMLALRLKDDMTTEQFNGSYGFIDEKDQSIVTGNRHITHFFCQGNNAIGTINGSLLAELLPRGTGLQIWQRNQYYVIHLSYYGENGRQDRTSNIAPGDLYFMLKGLGVLE